MSTRPHHRPPMALRAFVGLCGLAAAAATAALMLSDRAPGVLRRVFGRLAVRISERLEAGDRARLIDAASDARLPATDRLVHVALWATVTGLAGLAVWSWWGLVGVAVAIAGASVVVELLQGRLADSRAVEAGDVGSNLVGVGAGVTACVVAFAAWSAVASLITAPGARSSRSPGRR